MQDNKDKLINSKSKLFCMEVNPPRGTDCSKVFKRLDKHLDSLDFFNVTDNALARMRMNAFSFAVKLKNRYNIEPLVNLSCRDRNLLAMQSDILGAYSDNIHSIVALTGDAISTGDNSDKKAVFEVNSIGLLDLIAKLNAGEDLAGNKLEGSPEIYSGAVCNPNANNIKAEIKKLKKKQDAGAIYALSQPVFSTDQATEFFNLAKKEVNLRIFLGLLPFRDLPGLKRIANVPGLKVSSELISEAEQVANNNQGDLREFSVSMCLNQAKELSDLVGGYHVVCGVNPISGLKLLKKLKGI